MAELNPSSSLTLNTKPIKEVVTNNMVYLTEHITSIDKIVYHLIQRNILTFEHQEEIKHKKTKSSRIATLLNIIIRMDLKVVDFLKILNDTSNNHCVSEIRKRHSSTVTDLAATSEDISQSKNQKQINPNSKWWPKIKPLPQSFYPRKVDGKLLVEELNANFRTNSTMTVISQAFTVSGLGGIGKSTTAKWFAHHFAPEYVNIIWVDCGEDSLLDSFVALARTLDLKDRKELKLKQLAAGCFEILQDTRCLWIYDNAECYQGDKGIQDVLPEGIKKFDVIITSRNCEWGNSTGLGEIPQFQMEAFNKKEGVDFMTINIPGISEDDNAKLEKLCELLGNLPLALQIAVATLKKKKINLVEYIQRVMKTDTILHLKFDDYEKSINKTMNISLELIQNHERSGGGLAYRILTTFGYITPDNVNSDFFNFMESVMKADIDDATDLLAEYSLITKSVMDTQGNQSGLQLLSIHRLLQQVIRLTEKPKERDNLKKILRCKHYVEYKLLPLSYADAELQKQFPEIHDELMKKLNLNKLMIERKFQAAVHLSRIIKDSVSNFNSKYNVGACLIKNWEFHKAKEIFEDLYNEALETTISDIKNYRKSFDQFSLIDAYGNLTKDIIAGQLLVIKSDEKLNSNLESLLPWNPFSVLPLKLNSVKKILLYLNSINSAGYRLSFNEELEYLHVDVKEILGDEESLIHLNDGRHLHFIKCTLNSKLPLDGTNFKSLKLTNLQMGSNSFENVRVKYVTLKNVTLPQNQFSTTHIISSFDRHHLQKLTINGMFLDMSIDFEIPEVLLEKVEVISWVNSKWKIERLVLNATPFTEKTQMKITELSVSFAKVDISVLPEDIKNLSLICCDIKERSEDDEIIFSQLKELSLLMNSWTSFNGKFLTDHDIWYLIPGSLTRLKLDCEGSIGNITSLSVSSDRLRNVKYIELLGFSKLNLSPGVKLKPTELALSRMSFGETPFKINSLKFINFTSMQKFSVMEMTIADLGDNITVPKVHLEKCEVNDWSNVQWKIQEITLVDITFVDLSFVSKCTQSIHLINSTVVNSPYTSSEDIKLYYNMKDFEMSNVKFRKHPEPEAKVELLTNVGLYPPTVTANIVESNELLWFEVDFLTKFFTGRDDQIEKIHDCWNESENSNSLTFVVITGLGGVGKTELAKAYAEKFYSEVQGHCIWINAESHDSMLASFERLASKLKIILDDSPSLEDLTTEVYQELFTQNCLFVFDNLDNYENPILTSLTDYSDGLSPAEIKPFVLLTSRFQMVERSFGYSATHLKLDVLNPEYCCEFFTEALSVSKTSGEVISTLKEISKKLNFFPLALQQSLANIMQNQQVSSLETALENLIDCFDKDMKSILTFPLPGIENSNDFRKMTFTTWDLNFDKIIEESQITSRSGTFNVLNVIAFLHYEKISVEFVQKIFERNNTDLDDHSTEENITRIFELLDNYSMCERSKIGDHSFVSFNPLVQLVMQLKLKEKGYVSEILKNLLDRLDEIFQEEMANSNDIIQIKSVLKHSLVIKGLIFKYQFINLFSMVFKSHTEAKEYNEGLFISSLNTVST